MPVPVLRNTKIKRRKMKRRQRLSSIIIAICCLCFCLFTVFGSLLLAFPSLSSSFILAIQNEHLSAVQRAKFFGLPQRQRNSGHDKTRLAALSTSKCDAQGAEEFLSNAEIRHLKLPQAILIGAQKGGTTALYQYLDQHPDIQKTQKELYFLDEAVDQLLVKKHPPTIPRKMGRNLYFQKMREGILQQEHENSTNQTHKMVLDMTPNYMLHSDRVPARIRCLVPWAKVFVLLRDPIERASSQYEMKLQMTRGNRNQFGNPIPTFDEYVKNDLAALYEIGVLQDWTTVDFEDFWKSQDCAKAWQIYIHSGLNAPVGFGLYALQLVPFLDMLSSMERSDQFLAIDSQALREHTDKTFNTVLHFLGLKPMSLERYPTVYKAKHKHELSRETREEFQRAIEPYNKKLGDLLGDEWRDKWTISLES